MRPSISPTRGASIEATTGGSSVTSGARRARFVRCSAGSSSRPQLQPCTACVTMYVTSYTRTHMCVGSSLFDGGDTTEGIRLMSTEWRQRQSTRKACRLVIARRSWRKPRHHVEKLPCTFASHSHGASCGLNEWRSSPVNSSGKVCRLVQVRCPWRSPMHQIEATMCSTVVGVNQHPFRLREVVPVVGPQLHTHTRSPEQIQIAAPSIHMKWRSSPIIKAGVERR